MAEMDENPFFEKIKSQVPKFYSSFFDLAFDTARSIYKPGREVEGNNIFKTFGGGPATENIVLTDFNAKSIKASKKVFKQKFFVPDSARVIDWKEKDEIRTSPITKAVGRICDSVYVVAVYTEDIVVSGDPEIFGGLPGMIMEVAIPRLHTTWTATHVELTPPLQTDFAVSKKGKKVTENNRYETVKAASRIGGKWHRGASGEGVIIPR